MAKPWRRKSICLNVTCMYGYFVSTCRIMSKNCEVHLILIYLMFFFFQNNVPVYCPGLTDGSLGDMLYFHSFRSPGLVIDVIQGKCLLI